MIVPCWADSAADFRVIQIPPENMRLLPVVVGYVSPVEMNLLCFGSAPKGTCSGLALLHSRMTYFRAIKALSCILKHFPFFTWITTIKQYNTMYINFN